MSGHPFVEYALEVFSWYTTIEFSHVALHGTPDAFNMVAHAKVANAMVVSFSGIAEPFYATVACCAVGDEMTISRHPTLKE